MQIQDTTYSHQNGKDKATFISDLSKAITAFINDSLSPKSGGPLAFFQKKRLESGTSNIAGDRLTLVLAHITTAAESIESSLVEKQVEIDGDTVAVSMRSPWHYQLDYALIGPALHTSEGMRDAGRLHSLFFDHPELPASFLRDQDVEHLGRVSLKPDSKKSELSPFEFGVDNRNLGILFSFAAGFLFSTGKAVAVDKRVTRRKIRVGAS